MVSTDPFKKILGDSNIEAVIELSGVVNQYFWLKQQNEGTVFAGPPSGCGTVLTIQILEP